MKTAAGKHGRKQTWLPRDGDAIIAKEGFVFYVIGYLHPPGRAVSYLKYVPKKLSEKFSLQWLPFEWKLGETELVRPARLYTPENYSKIVSAFRSNYPEYLMEDHNLNKTLLVVPESSVMKVFEPWASLSRLFQEEQRRRPDDLEIAVIKLVRSISARTKVPTTSLGVHGSISLGMHTSKSDIDVAVYGAANFAKVSKYLNSLSERHRDFTLLEETIYDTLRRNRFVWNGIRVVINAIRKHDEMKEEFGDFNYIATGRHLSFICEVTQDQESVFRPAIYGVSGYNALDQESKIEDIMKPSQVVSMIGELRGIASEGDRIKVSGSLEKVEEAKTRKLDHCRVVVGSGDLKPQDEFISIISHS